MNNKSIMAGIAGGVAGGLVFAGILLAMGMFGGMMTTISKLASAESAAVGFVLHLVFSVVIGAGFALVFGAMSRDYVKGGVFGLIYGIIWWVLGPLVIMPYWMGVVQDGVEPMIRLFDAAEIKGQMMSLVLHLVFGLVLGLVYAAMAGKGGDEEPSYASASPAGSGIGGGDVSQGEGESGGPEIR